MNRAIKFIDIIEGVMYDKYVNCQEVHIEPDGTTYLYTNYIISYNIKNRIFSVKSYVSDENARLFDEISCKFFSDEIFSYSLAEAQIGNKVSYYLQSTYKYFLDSDNIEDLPQNLKVALAKSVVQFSIDVTFYNRECFSVTHPSVEDSED